MTAGASNFLTTFTLHLRLFPNNLHHTIHPDKPSRRSNFLIATYSTPNSNKFRPKTVRDGARQPTRQSPRGKPQEASCHGELPLNPTYLRVPTSRLQYLYPHLGHVFVMLPSGRGRVRDAGTRHPAVSPGHRNLRPTKAGVAGRNWTASADGPTHQTLHHNIHSTTYPTQNRTREG